MGKAKAVYNERYEILQEKITDWSGQDLRLSGEINHTALSDALGGLVPSTDPNLLVDIDTADDASVYKVSPEIAMIQGNNIIR